VLWGGLIPSAIEARYFNVLHPVSYALPVGLFGTLIYELTEFHYLDTDVLAIPYVTALALLALMLWVEARLLQDYDMALSAPLAIGVFGITALLALPSMVAPGILAGLLVAVLGFRRRDALLRGIAYVFLIGFVGEFYYALDTSLLTKSLIMAFVGAVMLVGRFGFQRIQSIPQAEGNIL